MHILPWSRIQVFQIIVSNLGIPNEVVLKFVYLIFIKKNRSWTHLKIKFIWIYGYLEQENRTTLLGILVHNKSWTHTVSPNITPRTIGTASILGRILPQVLEHFISISLSASALSFEFLYTVQNIIYPSSTDWILFVVRTLYHTLFDIELVESELLCRSQVLRSGVTKPWLPIGLLIMSC